MIEDVLVTPEGGYTRGGERHVRLLAEYGVLMNRWRDSLLEDFPRFRPVDGCCSPYGVIFGLPTHLIEHMALKAIQADAEARFGLEDVFADGDAGGAKLAWVNGWRELPHVGREVRELYAYPQGFAEEVFNRLLQEAAGREAFRTGRVRIVEGEKLGAEYLAEGYDAARMVAARREGHFLVSFEAPDGWVALKKDLLTEVLGEGRDATIAGFPPHAVRVLTRMCGDLTSHE